MTACEKCWTEASRRALMLGGMTADHYRALLAEDTDHETTQPGDDCDGNGKQHDHEGVEGPAS